MDDKKSVIPYPQIETAVAAAQSSPLVVGIEVYYAPAGLPPYTSEGPMIDLTTLGVYVTSVFTLLALVIYVTAARDCGSYNPITIYEVFQTSREDIRLYNTAFSKRNSLVYHLSKARAEGHFEIAKGLSQELKRVDDDIDEMERVMRFRSKKRD